MSVSYAAAIALCCALPAAAAEPQPTLTVEKYRLKNGLTVILSEDHRLPQVAVDVWYQVGAANQSPGRSGFAHLFEHLLFSGAKHLPQPPIPLLETLGVSTRATNGTTNFDRTNYFEVVPAKELPLALWIESERMGFFLETLDQKKLAIQRDVVSNERRQRHENRPYGMASLRMCEILYPPPHPYSGCVIGEIADVQAASLADVRAFSERYYHPGNASISVVGDFDPGAAKQLIARYFETLPAGPRVPVPNAPTPSLKGVVVERLSDPLATVPRFTLAWHGTKPYAPDELAGDFVAMILGQGRTSRLYRELVLKRQIASGVSADNSSLRLGGWFAVSATATAGHTADELKEAIAPIVSNLRENGPNEQEMDRARRRMLAGRLRGLERIGGFGGKADLLNELEMFVGDPNHLSALLEDIKKVTAKDVHAFAQRYLAKDGRLELSVVPAPPPARTEAQ